MNTEHEPVKMVYSHRSNSKRLHRTRHGMKYCNHWYKVYKCPRCGNLASRVRLPAFCCGVKVQQRKMRVPESKGLIWLKAIVAESTTSECVIWPFCIDAKSGYGKLTFAGKKCTAHRAALILKTGENHPGKEAAHGPCHNRRCCNPHHLSWKTVAENHADKIRDDTHNRGQRHYRAKLTPEQVREILADGRMHKVIAGDYGISRSVVSAIKTGLHWKWIYNEVKAHEREQKNRDTETAAPSGANGSEIRGDGSQTG